MSQRDEIAHIVFGVANQRKTQLYEHECYSIADALLAAGLLVPPDMTALKLIHHDGDDMVVYTAEEMAEARENFIRLFGYVLPPGLTAETLREIARRHSARDSGQPAALEADADRADLRAWADFLDTQETPQLSSRRDVVVGSKNVVTTIVEPRDD